MRHARLVALLAATISLTACGSSDNIASTATPPPATVTPKNVIFFLGDGYGMVPDRKSVV